MIDTINRYLDIINVMAYDLHGPWDLATGANAPLYPASNEKTPEELELNVVIIIMLPVFVQFYSIVALGGLYQNLVGKRCSS